MATRSIAASVSSAPASAAGSIRPRASVRTSRTASSPSPSRRADFCTLKWLEAVATMTSRRAASARLSPAATRAAIAVSRASSSACRFDCVPPEVNTPSPAANPIRPHVQSTSLRSMSVPIVDWS